MTNTATTTEARANPYLYAGYMYDKEIEPYYLMARYYEPAQGVFTAYDPGPGDEDDPQTMNGYNYANNNPVMMIARLEYCMVGGSRSFRGCLGSRKVLLEKRRKYLENFNVHSNVYFLCSSNNFIIFVVFSI